MDARKSLVIVTGTLLVLGALAALPATAISPAEECENDGGTLVKEKGTFTCVKSPGNNQGGVTKETSQKGAYDKSSHEQEECNVKDGETVNCPPGKNK